MRVAFWILPKTMQQGCISLIYVLLPLRFIPPYTFMCMAMLNECTLYICIYISRSVTAATTFRNGSDDDENTEEGKHSTDTRVIDGQHITTNDHMRKVYQRERTCFLCRFLSKKFFNVSIRAFLKYLVNKIEVNIKGNITEKSFQLE